MPNVELREPVSRYIAQLRLEASDKQWSAIEPHLTRFEGPGGLTLFEWADVLAAVCRLSESHQPLIAQPHGIRPRRAARGERPRRRSVEKRAPT
jgi:transposase